MRARIVAAAVLFSIPAALVLCPLESAKGLEDQDKRTWHLTEMKFTRSYNDTDGDGWHDPAEALTSRRGGRQDRADREDYSCWIASACNMVNHEPGFGDPGLYELTLEWGVCFCSAEEPCRNPWDQKDLVTGGGGGFRTFDDGGWQHLLIEDLGWACQGPILSTHEFVPGWPADPDPLDWCSDRLAEGHAVGLTVWWGDNPGHDHDDPELYTGAGPIDYYFEPYRFGSGYHCITLWEIVDVREDITGTRGTLTITDSDDWIFGFEGPRDVAYSYEGGDWKILGLYPAAPEAHVNYAVAVSGEVTPVKGSTWSAIKAMYR